MHLTTDQSAVTKSRDEPAAGGRDMPESIPNSALLERVLERANLQRALKQVRSNQGAPGIDGMTVEELPDYLRLTRGIFARNWWQARIARSRYGVWKSQADDQVFARHTDGVGSLHSASHCASRTGAMGTALSPVELRISPEPLGPPGRAPIAGGYSRRLPLGGGSRLGSVL